MRPARANAHPNSDHRLYENQKYQWVAFLSKELKGNFCKICVPNSLKGFNKPFQKVGRSDKKREQSPGIFSRCLNVLTYLMVAVMIPPFLNYAALQQEGTALMTEGLFLGIH